MFALFRAVTGETQSLVGEELLATRVYSSADSDTVNVGSELGSMNRAKGKKQMVETSKTYPMTRAVVNCKKSVIRKSSSFIYI